MDNYKKGQNSRVETLLNFMSNLSRNICLAQYWNKKDLTCEKRDPLEFFMLMLEENTATFYSEFEEIKSSYRRDGFDKMFEGIPHNINFDTLDEGTDILIPHFKRSRNLDSMWAFIEDYGDLINEITNNSEFYNKLRTLVRKNISIELKMRNSDNPISLLNDYLPFTNLKTSFSNINPSKIIEQANNKKYSKITSLYMNLDLLGYAPDKISDKNQFDNMANDSFHCFYAAYCAVYITEDKKHLRKSKAVYKNIGNTTLVMKPSEFLDYLQSLA